MRRRTQAERRADTRRRLLDSARKTFAARGFDATSLDTVAAEAGMTKGAVYDHFGSKDGLVLALLDEQFDRRLAESDELPSARPSQVMAFDREFTLLFLEFVCAAGRDPKLRRRLAARLDALRDELGERLGDREAANLIGAAANGASIDGVIYGQAAGAAVFDRVLAAIASSERRNHDGP